MPHSVLLAALQARRTQAAKRERAHAKHLPAGRCYVGTGLRLVRPRFPPVSDIGCQR